MSERTTYTYKKLQVDLPRCRNSHSLAPMFALYGDDKEMITDPIPMAQVPQELFWRNSDGYGFDVRNLSVLLRVNFRNLNPHTVNEDSPRPIWCNADDLASLLFHSGLDEKVRATVWARIELLNLLSDRSKVLLALAAHELYSATYQGFYDWVADQTQFDSLMRAMGFRSTQRDIMVEIEELQRRRQGLTLAGIQSHLSTQAAEHFCEPAGVGRESELYQILEFYKAGITTNLIEYLQQLAAKRRGICRSVQVKLHEYRALRMTAIARRYARAFDQAIVDRRRPGLTKHLQHAKEVLIWHLVFNVNQTRRDGTTHIRLLYAPKTLDYIVRINDTPLCVANPESILKLLDDMVPHFLDARKKLRVVSASLSGGLASTCCFGRRWKHTIRSDNVFLLSQAHTWLLRMPFTDWVDGLITQRRTDPLWTQNPETRVKRVLEQLDPHFRDVMHYSIAKHVALVAPEIFEFELLNRLQLTGGYDDFHGTLLDKLRAAMNNRTCIQDVGGELCELLSVPYPPEREADFARFQCDHTNIPPLIAPRVPVSLAPVNHLRLLDTIPEISLEYHMENQNDNDDGMQASFYDEEQVEEEEQIGEEEDAEEEMDEETDEETNGNVLRTRRNAMTIGLTLHNPNVGLDPYLLHN